MRREAYIETPKERRSRMELERGIKRRMKTRYRIQINLCGGHVAHGKWAAASLPFFFVTAAEAWAYAEKINPMKFFPEARSLSVEYIG